MTGRRCYSDQELAAHAMKEERERKHLQGTSVYSRAVVKDRAGGLVVIDIYRPASADWPEHEEGAKYATGVRLRYMNDWRYRRVKTHRTEGEAIQRFHHLRREAERMGAELYWTGSHQPLEDRKELEA